MRRSSFWVYPLVFCFSLSLLLLLLDELSSTYPTIFHNAASLSNWLSAPLEPSLEPVVLTFVLMGAPAAREGLTAIKSALMYSSRPLEIHLICTDDAIPVAEAPLLLVQRPYYNVNVTFHVLPPERVKQRLERAVLSTHAGFMTKVLIHEILQGVEKTIFVDTDMIFAVDPVQLWDTFETLDSNDLMAFPNLGPGSDASLVCTCVMLLNLNRMRNPPTSESTSAHANTPFLIPTPYHPDILTPALNAVAKDGLLRTDLPYQDQGVWWVLWSQKPQLFQNLHRRWDITGCRQYYGLKLVDDPKDLAGKGKTNMTEKEHIHSQEWDVYGGEDLVVPGLLHFNCKDDPGANVWEWGHLHNSNLNTWAPMVTSIVKYKWVWLNRGTDLHTGHLSIEKKFGVRWLDESKDTLIH